MDPYEDYVAFWSDACRAGGGTVETGPVTRLRGPPGNLPVYGVVRFDGSPEEARAEVEGWQARGAPFTFVTQDDEVATALEEAGLRLHNEFVLMHKRVEPFGQPAHEIHWVDDPTPMVDLLVTAHDIPPEARDAALRSIGQVHQAGRLHMAVVYDGELPVGCASLYTGGGHAGMYSAVVRASHRRRGIGASIAQGLMLRAEALGLEHAVASTTPDGRALSAALGFEEVGIIRQFVWFPGRPE